MVAARLDAGRLGPQAGDLAGRRLTRGGPGDRLVEAADPAQDNGGQHEHDQNAGQVSGFAVIAWSPWAARKPQRCRGGMALYAAPDT